MGKVRIVMMSEGSVNERRGEDKIGEERRGEARIR